MSIGGGVCGAWNLGEDGGNGGIGGVKGEVDSEVVREGCVPVGDGSAGSVRGVGSKEEGAGGMHKRGESCSTYSSPSPLSRSATHRLLATLLVCLAGGGKSCGSRASGAGGENGGATLFGRGSQVALPVAFSGVLVLTPMVVTRLG